MEPIIPKSRLLREVKRFLYDPKRGISHELFAELCGISKSLLMAVFYYETEPMTETTQIRVSRGYQAWQRGEIAVMQYKNQRYLEFRKEPKPIMKRTTGLQVVNGEIKIKLGIKNKADYSDVTFEEQLGGKHG